MELKAAGFTHGAETKVLDRVRERCLSELTLLDFLGFCPLFLGTHDTIVKNPFDAK